MATTTEMIAATGVCVDTDQDFEIDIPVLSGMQRQGDVIVLPVEDMLTLPLQPCPSPELLWCAARTAEIPMRSTRMARCSAT